MDYFENLRNKLTLLPPPVVGGVLLVGGVVPLPVPADPTVISAEPLLW